MTIIGFTGTQIGMTEAQKNSFGAVFISSLNFLDEFHHGDCIGADADAHNIIRNISTIPIIIHPPINPAKRAFKAGDKILEPKEYLDRNQDIVKACEILIVTPKETIEQLRSGTWFTFRQAQRNRKRWVIIYPDGSIVK